MNTKAITIWSDFSKFPAGRYRTDGSWSGQKFREDVLVPALQRADRIVLQMDGTLGYGSSFLEEAFGGLVRSEGFKADELRTKLDIQASDKSLKTEIWEYIEKAKPAKPTTK